MTQHKAEHPSGCPAFLLPRVRRIAMNFAYFHCRSPPSSSQRNKQKCDLEENMKIIKIKDYSGNYQCVHVDDQFFDEWCKMRKEDYNQRRQLNCHCISFEEIVLESLCDRPYEDPIFEEYRTLVKSVRDGSAINTIAEMTDACMYAISARMSAYSGLKFKFDWALRKPKKSLLPENLKFGKLPIEPLAISGEYKII